MLDFGQKGWLAAMLPSYRKLFGFCAAFGVLLLSGLAAQQVTITPRPKPAVKPVNLDGRRWPQPASPPAPTLWRLSVSYWRVVREGAEPAPNAAARRLRRDPEAQGLNTRALQALARQPLRATEPQRALDIGLFEVRLPEAPDRIVPDE